MCPLKFDSVRKNRFLELVAKLEKSEDKWLAAAAFHVKTRKSKWCVEQTTHSLVQKQGMNFL